MDLVIPDPTEDQAEMKRRIDSFKIRAETDRIGGTKEAEEVQQMEARGAREGREGRKRRRWHPTAEEVIDRIRDDGDFDSLRLSLSRNLKHNDQLRKSIVEEVKQSLVLNDDISDKIKIRDLSDALYQELGGKIMGKISDEVWDAINLSEQEIQETVESVYYRILHPEKEKKKKKEDTSNSALGNNQNCIKQENEPDDPPGFALPTKDNESLKNDVAPPGFGSAGDVNEMAKGPSEDDLDAPPGFS
ncbi:hypothetical protein FCM35_KLT15907 [Carex littledalei]|uniref:Uncharacterized protein n=1 Tax=Carex littledalei TaxID=544730 RepID=A0A833VJ84_9POAL|nr:hypothetical protein FCM35_KLT15907 [Carex littledalei]